MVNDTVLILQLLEITELLLYLSTVFFLFGNKKKRTYICVAYEAKPILQLYLCK